MNISMKIEHLPDVQREIAKLGPNAVHAKRIWGNTLGEQMQRQMRTRLPQRFTQRGTAEAFSRAIVLSVAKQNSRRTETILRIGSDGAAGTKATGTKKLGIILARHEDADTRRSNAVFRTSSGDVPQGFFIPAKGLRTSSQNPPRSLYPTSIGAQMRRGDGRADNYFAKSVRKTRKVKGQVVRGESFYVIKNVGIFRRRASAFGASDGEPIWWFAQQVRTPARLKLYETAQEVFDRFAVAYGMDAVQLVIDRSS